MNVKGEHVSGLAAAATLAQEFGTPEDNTAVDAPIADAPVADAPIAGGVQSSDHAVASQQAAINDHGHDAAQSGNDELLHAAAVAAAWLPPPTRQKSAPLGDSWVTLDDTVTDDLLQRLCTGLNLTPDTLPDGVVVTGRRCEGWLETTTSLLVVIPIRRRRYAVLDAATHWFNLYDSASAGEAKERLNLAQVQLVVESPLSTLERPLFMVEVGGRAQEYAVPAGTVDVWVRAFNLVCG